MPPVRVAPTPFPAIADDTASPRRRRAAAVCIAMACVLAMASPVSATPVTDESTAADQRGEALVAEAQWMDETVAVVQRLDEAGGARARFELTGMKVRYGTPSDSIGAGLAYLDVRGTAVLPIGSDLQPSRAMPALGIGYRHRFSDVYRFEAEAFVASTSVLPVAYDQPTSALYGADMRMEFSPRKPSLGLESGAVSMRFSSSSNMAIRIRKGGPMLFMRARF